MSPRLELLVLFIAGWINRQRQDVIDYLKEENRASREQLGGRRLRLSDAQRRRLANEALRPPSAPQAVAGVAGRCGGEDRARSRSQRWLGG